MANADTPVGSLSMGMNFHYPSGAIQFNQIGPAVEKSSAILNQFGCKPSLRQHSPTGNLTTFL
jgi:hypothetical protein